MDKKSEQIRKQMQMIQGIFSGYIGNLTEVMKSIQPLITKVKQTDETGLQEYIKIISSELEQTLENQSRSKGTKSPKKN